MTRMALPESEAKEATLWKCVQVADGHAASVHVSFYVYSFLCNVR